ncbi:PAS domain-containing protein [Celeribacter sp.]|uniref:PAS domain-containing protein n=1 Tax=Celeribacter sp. TaxID=1890673 RepID=UPI003A92BFB4
MNIQAPAPDFALKNEEAPFDISELFFSRTDERGVIEAGNAVFQRVSGYEWSALIGAPHKVVRHSDMPKGLFHILWARLKAGLPTGAYIKNRAADGRYYWVYAIVTPIEGGYVSVRLKPTSPVLQTVFEEYAEAVRAETEEGLSAEQSAARMCERVGGLGFATYDAFSSYAIANEILARDRALGREEDQRIKSLKFLLPALKEIESEQKKLFHAFEAIRGIPSNMRIVASRLEPAGGPISAISQNYRLMSNEVTEQLSAFSSDDGSRNLSDTILERVYRAMFIVAAARVQREVGENAHKAIQTGDQRDGFQYESEVLETILEDYMRQSTETLASVYQDIARLMQSSKDLKQLVTGLDSIRVLCRVEAGRLGSNSVALTPVIDQLDRFHVDIDRTLERIVEHAAEVKRLVEKAMPRSVSRTMYAVHGNMTRRGQRANGLT